MVKSNTITTIEITVVVENTVMIEIIATVEKLAVMPMTWAVIVLVATITIITSKLDHTRLFRS